MGIILSEIILLDEIRSFITELKSDAPTILDRIFDDFQSLRPEFRDGLIEELQDPDVEIPVTLGWTLLGSKLPIITIVMFSDVQNNQFVGQYSTADYSEVSGIHYKGEILGTLSRRTLQIEVLSGNADVTTALYYAIRWHIIRREAFFNSKGLLEIEMSGGDIQHQPELYPELAYARFIRFMFTVEDSYHASSAPSIEITTVSDVENDITFNMNKPTPPWVPPVI